MQSRIGVNGHLASRALLDLAAQAGLHSMRGDFNWDDIQPEPDPNPDHWRWGPTDALVYGCRERDIEVFATLAYTPDWANGGQGRYVPPHHVEDWRRFVRAVAERYRHNVWSWGLWNEPNRDFFTGTVEQYVQMIVTPAAEILHAIGPENRVCGPDLATEGDWPSWFRLMLRGTRGLLDIVTVHSYQPDGLAVWRALTQEPPWYEPWRPPGVRQVMASAGAGHLPLWLTESGWWAESPGEEAHQADAVEQVLEKMQASHEVERFFYYRLIDEPQEKRGAYRDNGSPKPVVEVFRRFSPGAVVARV
jgi:Glycosyl hydrolases family 39